MLALIITRKLSAQKCGIYVKQAIVNDDRFKC